MNYTVTSYGNDLYIEEYATAGSGANRRPLSASDFVRLMADGTTEVFGGNTKFRTVCFSTDVDVNNL